MRYFDNEGGTFKGAFVLSRRSECEKVVDEKTKQIGFVLRDPLMCVIYIGCQQYHHFTLFASCCIRSGTK